MIVKYERDDAKSIVRLYDGKMDLIQEVDHQYPIEFQNGVMVSPDLSDIDKIDQSDRTLTFERIIDSDE